MHPESRKLMGKHLGRVDWPQASVLDVGSLDGHGWYRKLVRERGWSYTGLDLIAGPNVDIVVPEPYRYPFPDGLFDAVISGSTLEHVAAIWLWVPELARILRPGGLLAIVAPFKWEEHKHPLDCWRVLPDGMRTLFDLTGCLEDYVIEKDRADTAGSAFKRAACTT